MSERFVLARRGCDLAGERWPGGAALVVLLHEGGPGTLRCRYVYDTVSYIYERPRGGDASR